jgi:hypothetical protein
MKIMSLDEFLAMPNGTVFAFFNPFTAESTMVKGDTCDGKFKYSPIERLNLELDSSTPREFEVWEQAEVDALLAKLQQWKPIETAPKDGTRILCRGRAENASVEIAEWSGLHGWLIHGYADTIDAIEWMPIAK